jgi:hypothetical protein
MTDDLKPTVREILQREIAGNPRWVEAKSSGEAFEILGARPTAQNCAPGSKREGRCQ